MECFELPFTDKKRVSGEFFEMFSHFFFLHVQTERISVCLKKKYLFTKFEFNIKQIHTKNILDWPVFKQNVFVCCGLFIGGSTACDLFPTPANGVPN